MAVLKSGSKGGPVKKLQEQLNKTGAKPKLDVDGIFGPLTAEAVKTFQKKSKLKADGIVGPNTEGALSGGKAGSGGAGASKGAGAGGGKTGSGGGKEGLGLPKDTMAKFKRIDKIRGAYFDAWAASDEALAKAAEEIYRNKDLSEKERVKELKPVAPRISKLEKVQKTLVGDLMGIRNLTDSIDPKSGDRGAKSLIKKGQAMDAIAKKYTAHSKSTKKKTEKILKKMIKDTPEPAVDVAAASTEIYTGPLMVSLEDAINDLRDEAKKAA